MKIIKQIKYKFYKLIMLLFVFLGIQAVMAQTNLESAKTYIEKNTDFSKISKDDIKNLIITSQHLSKKSGVEHIYLKQTLGGIEVNGSSSSLHLKNKEVLKFNQGFLSISKNKVAFAKLDAKTAIERAAKELGLKSPTKLIAVKQEEGINRKGVYSNGGISQQDIPVKLVYQPDKESSIRLAWDLSIHELDDSKAWRLKIDAQTGELVEKTSLINFYSSDSGTCSHGVSETSVGTTTTKEHSNEISFNSQTNDCGIISSTYNVYALPLESPYEGNRSFVTCPEDMIASPEGWTGYITNNLNSHDLNFGINVRSHNNVSQSSYTSAPNVGITSLTYDYQIDTIYTQSNPSLEAVTINAFYWANIVHDISYHYGFDEVAGNFQNNNFGRGGIENDGVYLIANSAGNCYSAMNSEVEDGVIGTIYLGVCDFHHHALDNKIVIHEYAHGISNRLVGGALDPECLDNVEQMGEGWSDWYALMLTMENTDLGEDIRAHGNYGYHLGVNSPGNRTYSTDMAINNLTYDNVSNAVHANGEIWSSMLWELTWGLIDVYGFDTDFYYGSGGNNMALMLVTEGLKLTPCSPGFVDGRDAIIAADQALYGGANECIIWQAFAKRGLGFGASQGSSSDDIADGTASFDLPESCTGDCPINIHHTGIIPTDNYQSGRSIVSTGTIGNNQNVDYDAANFVCLFPNFLADAEAGSVFFAHIDGCVPLRESSSLSNNINSKIFIENHPNPFEDQTMIVYTLEEDMRITASIKDINGKTIAKLIGNEYKSKGNHEVVFDGTDLPAGIYYCTIQAGDDIQTQKMVLSK